MDREVSEDRAEGFALAASTSFVLSRALQVAADEFAQCGHAVNLRQFYVLAAIEANRGANQNDLVEITGVDRSTLADMLKKFAHLGLIGKAPSPTDARANLVELTPLGARLREKAQSDADKADRAIIELLSDKQGERLQKLLERLNERIDRRDARRVDAEKAERRREKRAAARMKKRAKRELEKQERAEKHAERAKTKAPKMRAKSNG